jgi:glycosyltransferase involved in cell wall biosynthesis
MAEEVELSEMVSVIIPTYNGAHKIAGLINALKNQTYKSFEVIVVIDGSTDGTASVIRKLDIGFAPFTIIEQENKGRGAVRNRGASEAKGELLIYFDDDMLPIEQCIERHVQHHKEFPNSILTGGLCEEVDEKSTEMLKYKSYLSNVWNKSLLISKSGMLEKGSIFITAANFSIAKRLFKTLGGFDERLNDAEDFDFSISAHKAGISMFFKQEAFAWHNDRITCVSYIKRQRQYIIAHKKLAELKPWIEKEGFRKPLKNPTGLRKKVFEFFSSEFWIKSIDQEKLRIIPQSARYKIYDLIITANGIYFPEKVKLS